MSAIAADLDLASIADGLNRPAHHEDPIGLAALDTPVGPMVAGACSEGLCLLEFFDRRTLQRELLDLTELLDRPVLARGSAASATVLRMVERELASYFKGALTRFETPLCRRGTPFEERVWEELLRIPYGQTCSYGQLAAAIGSPGASRAVGRANGRNRLAIVVPCHRVIEANGKLRGYGGGLERKRFLLDLEARGAGGSLFG